MHRCLFVDHFDYLGDECKALELKVQGVKRTDVGLNPLMVRHCHPVLLKYCGGTEGQERMQCLEDHVESPETTAACRSRVLDEPILRSKSVLLNPKVGTACKADLNFLIRTRRCKAPFQRLMLAHKDSGKMPYGIAGAGRRLRGNDNVIDEVKKELKKKKKGGGAPGGKGLLGKGLISEMEAAELRAAVKAASEELSGRDIECLLEHEGAEQNHARRSKKKTATIWKDPSKRWKGVQPMCKQALLTVKRDRAKDLRANPFGGEAACAADIAKFCDGVPEGAGAVNRCLQKHIAGGSSVVRVGDITSMLIDVFRTKSAQNKDSRLSDECAMLQGKILLDQAKDFVANPLLEYHCAVEVERYCKHIKVRTSRR